MKTLFAVATLSILAAAGASIPAQSPATAAPPDASSFDLLGEAPTREIRAQSPDGPTAADASAFNLLAQAEISPAAAAAAADLTPAEPVFEGKPAPSQFSAPEPGPPAWRSGRASAEPEKRSSDPSDFSLLDHADRWEIVNSTERPTQILYFTDESCPHCPSVDRSVLPRLAKHGWLIGSSPLSHLRIVTLRDTDLFSRYGVEGMPTFVLVREGKEIDRKAGKTPLGTDGYGRLTYRLITAEEIASWYNAEIDRQRSKRPGTGRSLAGSPGK